LRGESYVLRLIYEMEQDLMKYPENKATQKLPNRLKPIKKD